MKKRKKNEKQRELGGGLDYKRADSVHKIMYKSCKCATIKKWGRGKRSMLVVFVCYEEDFLEKDENYIVWSKLNQI